MGIYISNSEAETIKFGEKFGGSLKAGDGVFFKGEMGAGKTRFTKGIARAFGITEAVTSPTFAIVNEYDSEKNNLTVFHFDLFRISNLTELYDIGFSDYLERNGVIIVEWSENAGENIKELRQEFTRAFSVEILKLSENKREIIIEEM